MDRKVLILKNSYTHQEMGNFYKKKSFGNVTNVIVKRGHYWHCIITKIAVV